MIQCLSCATEIPETSRFCPGCGKPVADSSETAVMPESPAAAVGARVPSSETRLAPGTLLAGRYQIFGLLGRGGMGEVYRADDLTLDQPVALKFLPEKMAGDAAMLARFHAEVRIARQVSHPNVCRVYDIGEANGKPYLSMEYIDGEDLGSLLRRIGRLPPDKAIEFARHICAGLAAAHDKGVVHRDLKPGNIMIDGQGRAHIMDFGLAAVALELRGGQARQGTPAYMAPEQLAGTEVTARSDIYSLGLVLYEMFTGKRPFEAATLPEMIRLQQQSNPPSVTSVVKDVEPAVETVIQRCLAPDPRQRPASALAVAAALPGGDPLAAALAAGETPSPDMVASAGQATGLRPGLAVLCLAATLACVAGILLLEPRTQMIGHVAMENSPDVLAQKGRDLARALGYTAKPSGTARGFMYDHDYVQYVERTDKSAHRWARLAAGQPPPIVFWYRESPRPLVPEAFGVGMVTPSDPPPIVSNMVSVFLDPQGRLVEFDAMPPQVEGPAAGAPAPDWKRLFEAAGLDMARFTATAPQWTPLGSFDARAAWTGSYPSGAPGALRIEAAAWRGKPIYFQIIGPWTRPGRMRSFRRSAAERVAVTAGVSLVLLLMVMALLLAQRNARQGRADRRGAFRLAIFTGAVELLIWLFGGSHVAAVDELVLFLAGLDYALLLAASVWILYMAVEPFVRRRWPHSMITWNRLLAGHFRDPLVGRDLLAGVTLGMAALLLNVSHDWLSLRFGATPSTQVLLQSLLGVKSAIAMWLAMIQNCIVEILAYFLILFLLRMVFRRDWLAAAAFVLMFTGFALLGTTGPLGLAALFAAAGMTLLVIVMLRFGLVALIGTIFAYVLLLLFPMTNDFSAWYAGTSLFALLSVAAVAAFAFHAALAGRPLLGDEELG
jgi:Protein kinase domain